MVTHDYTVALEQVFHGPMDLLLHLVKEQEVDIHEIELGRVVEGYLAYIKDLHELDIELAADFLVMAATLMAIKSRSLLPREEIDLAAELDPRDELIQRLIEYRHFKQASRELSERFEERSRIFAHGWHPPTVDEATLDLSDLSQWDLLSAFSRLMRETLAHRTMVIKADERPLRFWVDRLVKQIQEHRELSLRAMVEDAVATEGASKPVLIGTFCALLELMKLGVVRAWQKNATDDIRVVLREDLGTDVADIVRMTEFEDERANEDAVAAEAATVDSTEATEAAATDAELADEPAG